MRQIFLFIILMIGSIGAYAQFEKGYRGFFEVSHSFSSSNKIWHEVENFSKTSFKDTNPLIITTTHGYQITPYFFLGGGLGISFWNVGYKDKYYDEDYVSKNEMFHFDTFMAFIEARFDFYSTKRVSFFETNKVGIAYIYIYQDYNKEDWEYFECDKIGVFLSPAIGIRYQFTTKFAMQFAIGYQYYQNHVIRWDKFYDRKEEINNNGIILSLGVDFK